ncbi:hypothetical protein ALNOE001_03150 [Candidatus Methanobinarius endosymbioticus]|uniref:Uncharacterized protein n=1 Tax=Candidatus Methanobinarius endosymbioticus TaxID=2006182 RepID=A0A366MDE4_9EURY|nr:hypothetical protein ALNOE001_03150 [Candidatus Methanobinarius endosymbioticus]
MSKKLGSGKVIDVQNTYDLKNIVIDEKFFTSLLKDEEDLDTIKKIEKFDIKLNNGRMLFDCEIDNQSSTDEGCVIRGYFVKFE